MARLLDRVEIEVIGELAGAFDLFTSFQIINDITQPSEGAFEVGNAGTWDDLQPYISHGKEIRVKVNDRVRLTGRVEMDDLPTDVGGGSTVRFTVRTKLADAQYSSAEAGVRVKDTSIQDFLLSLYGQLGYTAEDFVFAPYTARDLMTGRDSSGEDPDVDLESIKEEEAKVQPPETYFEAADRHLRRHGLMHWDSPDGRIVVAAPNDEQVPLYSILCNRNSRQRWNNVTRLTRTMDYSGIPSTLAVFGSSGRKGSARARLGAYAIDFDVTDAGFHRPVLVIAEGLRTLNLVERAAHRELAARSKQKDAFTVEADGLSYFDGNVSIPWVPDTTANVESDVSGGALGSYYIHRVVLNRDAGAGDRVNLNILKKGIWRI